MVHVKLSPIMTSRLLSPTMRLTEGQVRILNRSLSELGRAVACEAYQVTMRFLSMRDLTAKKSTVLQKLKFKMDGIQVYSRGSDYRAEVRHKFVGRRPTVGDLRAHDNRRHSRILSTVDLPLGGLGVPTDTGSGRCPFVLYFAEIGIGTPSRKYYVQVDTGSDILWVNCISCRRCPRKSDLGASGSGNLVSCQEKFCVSTYGDIPGCEANLPCQYSVMYGDGSSTSGYFVTDTIQYNQVSGNHQTKPVNASVTFG
ncbi:hypothetical protein GW17_00013421 [Ensete ventricosum]|nr:hypothetical protein GW17_00013421 [Ensete ventricosum]